MSEQEPKPAQAEVPPPSTGERLAWWLTIYLAGSVPLIVQAARGETAMPADMVLEQIPFAEPAARFLFFVFPYAFYLGHLYVTLKTRTRQSFDYLLVMLDVIVLLNQAILGQMGRSMHG